MARTLDTLTIGELREAISNFDDDMPVTVVCNFGDRNNTTQAIALSEVADNVFMSESGYSDSGLKVVEDGDQNDGDIEVVVLALYRGTFDEGIEKLSD